MQWKQRKDFFFMTPQTLMGQDLYIFEASRSHSDTHTYSVVLFWTSSQPDVETSTHSQETDIHTPAGLERTIPVSERPQTLLALYIDTW
jgi:hypothetical protein